MAKSKGFVETLVQRVMGYGDSEKDSAWISAKRFPELKDPANMACGDLKEYNEAYETCKKINSELKDARKGSCPNPESRPDPGGETAPYYIPIEELPGNATNLTLVTDNFRATDYPGEYPRPIMLEDDELERRCDFFNGTWRFCPRVNQERLEFLNTTNPQGYYQCDVRHFVAAVRCGFVDIGTLGRENSLDGPGKGKAKKPKTRVRYPGLVHTANEAYPIHGVCTDNMAREGAQPTSPNSYGFVKLPAVAHHLAVYPEATGHFFNQLPRLFLLLSVLPPDVPILVKRHKLMMEIIDILIKVGLVGRDRFIALDPPRIYTAKTVFFAGEMGRLPGEERWNTLPVERCAFGMAMHRELLRTLLVDGLDMQTDHEHLEVLVVDRSDASNRARSVSNHCDMMKKLSELLPHAKVREFVGTKVPFEAQIRAFMRADLLIAPHGAAIGLSGFMRPGGAILEIAYPLKRWPAIFMSTALSAKLKYYLYFGDKGKHSGPIHVNAHQVAQLAVKAAEDMGRYKTRSTRSRPLKAPALRSKCPNMRDD